MSVVAEEDRIRANVYALLGNLLAAPPDASLLEVLSQKLAGHWMFQTEEARRRLHMCEDCRVRDLFAEEARKGRR